ncbi:YlbG family protein [Bacillus alkalicellulosilyticus]|uniref:YlbG family protein n=1 Tax=Alkalihalobacterium alkalicellulosilyticum TaxID=1912214 RepID=UPI00099704B6|nr:DUF2129 domain-containing protein [Bacillus alkalicellulosilyticus]
MLSSQRQSVSVWLHSLKYARQLRKYGNVHYVSKKMKYVILYLDQTEVENTVNKLETFHYVKDVSVSMRPFIKTEYQNAKPDKAKEYDYRMGL